MELLQWLDLISVKEILTSKLVVQSVSVSSTVLLCYCLVSFINNKAIVFLFAFIVCEVIGGSVILDPLSEVNFYLFYAFLYCNLYYLIIFLKDYQFKQIVSCVMLILFSLGMSIDAEANKNAESFLYNNYEIIVAALHLRCCSVFINWKLLAHAMGQSVNNIFRLLRTSYFT